MILDTSLSHPPSTVLSVIIPTLNEAGAIKSVLGQFERLPGNWELIVADSGSTDGTLEIVTRCSCVRVVAVGRGRGVAMNAGAAVANGDVLLFLHADTFLPVDAFSRIMTALNDPGTSATAFHIRFDLAGFRFRFVEIVSRVRVSTQRTFFGDQGIAVRRRDFDRAGGFGEGFLMEDIELSRKLRRIGRLQILPAHVTTSARRFERGGVARTLVFMGCLQLAYFLRVPGDRLVRWYAAVR